MQQYGLKLPVPDMVSYAEETADEEETAEDGDNEALAGNGDIAWEEDEWDDR